MPSINVHRSGNWYVFDLKGTNLYRVEGSSTLLGGQSNYTGTGTAYGILGVGTKALPFNINVAGGFAGLVSHVKQNVALTASTQILAGLYVTANHSNVTCTDGEQIGADIYMRNPGTGILINGTGQRIMVYSASGAKTKYKKGLLIDVLDMSSSHVSGGGTQGICIQLNPTSITNNQVDAILINQNSAQTIASGIVFKGKMGNTNGSHAVLNFVGSGDSSHNEGNKQNLIKFRTGGTTYVMTPAQFKTVVGANCTGI